MKRGDIVLIKWPFTDLTTSKVRPALVISSDECTQRGEDAIFAFISSQTSKLQSTDVLLEDNDPEFGKTGLKKSSLIKTDKIACLSKVLASSLLGEVGRSTMSKLNKNLKIVLDLV
jgi:mRNA interferase MazF